MTIEVVLTAGGYVRDRAEAAEVPSERDSALLAARTLWEEARDGLQGSDRFREIAVSIYCDGQLMASADQWMDIEGAVDRALARAAQPSMSASAAAAELAEEIEA